MSQVRWACPDAPTGEAAMQPAGGVLFSTRRKILMLKAFSKAHALVNSLRSEEEGATAVEYGLIVALIAAVIVAVVVILGQDISKAFDKVEKAIP